MTGTARPEVVLSFVTMLRAGSALRALVLGAAALALAACGDDADTTTPPAATPAPVTQAPPPTAVANAPAVVVATPAPVAATPAAPAAETATVAAAAASATAIDPAGLLGNWAPDAATCAQGLVMTVTNTTITGTALGTAECTIDSRTRNGNDATIVATCSSPDAAFRSVRMTLQATILGEAPPAAMTVLQEGQGLAAAATQPIALIRCAAAPTP